MPDFKLPSFLFLFLTFVFLWLHHLNRAQKKHIESKEAFWKREEASLVVRKKEIPESCFYHPDLSAFCFPMPTMAEAKQKFEQLKSILLDGANLPMLCFRGLTNTDIRLEYGTANQPFILQAEENYEAFLGFLFEYAELMITQGEIGEAVLALEECIRMDSDWSKHYIRLADLYHSIHDTKAIAKLLDTVTTKTFPATDKIVDHIRSLVISNQ